MSRDAQSGDPVDDELAEQEFAARGATITPIRENTAGRSGLSPDAMTTNTRARLREARDMLIDVEDILINEVARDPELQGVIDHTVETIMLLTRKTEQ